MFITIITIIITIIIITKIIIVLVNSIKVKHNR